MATKPMKTLKLPGLDDTYTFLQNDATLTQSGKAADAKATGDALAAVQTQLDGVQAGQYPDMGAGQLLSENGTANPTPYTYRANSSGSDRVTISQITGGTVAWHQMTSAKNTSIDPPRPADNSPIDLTNAEGGQRTFSSRPLFNYTTVTGHKYLIAWTVTNAVDGGGSSGTGHDVYSLAFAGTIRGAYDVANGTYAKMAEGDSSGQHATNVYIYLAQTSNSSTAAMTITNLMLFDLTQMFGSAVADYIYGLETATAGAGIALFRQMFPESYYPYNAGELVSVQTSGRVSEGHTYPLDSALTLRGIPVLTDDGKMAYDGDKYAPDGTVTRRYGIVDLGTLNWGYAVSTGTMYATPPADAAQGTSNQVSPIICSKYQAGVATGSNDTDRGDGYIWLRYNANQIRVHDSAYTDAATFKAAMSGVYMVYLLATPTTETAAPYQEIQIAGSTEEFLAPETDTRPVAVPVGSQSLYQTNLRSGLETLLDTDLAHAESIAPVQGSTASSNIASGELLMKDGKLYKATQAIVAGAEIVPGTNATQTSVADVFKPTVYQLTPQGTGVTLDTTVSNIKVFLVYGLAVLTVKFTVTSSITNYLAFASCTDVRPNMGLGSDDGISVVVANATATKRITLALRPNGWMRVYPADTADNDGTYYATVVYPV